MAGVLCVWATHLAPSVEHWYEKAFIPIMHARHSHRTLLAKPIPTPFDEEFEVVGARDAEFESLVLYEVADLGTTVDTMCGERNHPDKKRMLGGTRFDVKSYELMHTWQDDDGWDGDAADVASILFWEWQPHAGFEEEISEYYRREVGPLFAQAPEMLRLRWFRVRNAAVQKGGSHSALRSEDLHTYVCVAEMDCEEWPWGEMFAINELPGWVTYFEGQRRVKWQVSQYVVKRSYPGKAVEEKT